MSPGIVFDLDGTLYDTSGLDTENCTAAVTAISEFMQIPEKASKHLLDEKRKGPHALSISKTMAQLGIPESIFSKHQLQLIQPELHIKPDPVLVSLMRKIKATHRLALYTNTRKELVPRIIKCLGFSEHDFDVIVAAGDVEEPKPSATELRKVLLQLGILPQNCFAVGDRWSVDLEPAEQLGMKLVHVHSRSDLLDWLKSDLT